MTTMTLTWTRSRRREALIDDSSICWTYWTYTVIKGTRAHILHITEHYYYVYCYAHSSAGSKWSYYARTS